MQKRQALILIAVATVFAAVVPQRELAFGFGCDKPKITEVQVDANPLDDTHVADFSIYGKCLDSRHLQVYLAQGQMGMFRELTITAQDDHMIAAYLSSLDSEQLAGDYLLKLRTCSIWGCWDRDEWDLTIGRIAPYVKRECKTATWNQGQRDQKRTNCDGNGANADMAISGGCELNATGVASLLVHRQHELQDNPAGVYNGYICSYRMPQTQYLNAAAQNALPVSRELCATVVCLPRNPAE